MSASHAATVVTADDRPRWAWLPAQGTWKYHLLLVVLGIFILGIGLYEAWKLTRALPIPILGPFSIQQGAPLRAAIEPSSHSLAADAAD